MQKILLLILAVVLAGGAEADDSAWRWSGVERVVAFADVHGAYDELVNLLQTAGTIDADLQWIGGRTHLVSTGDLLDRGPHSRKVMDLLIRLEKEAAGAGGNVHVLLGNHELMNLTGDFRYVSIQEYQAFADEESAGVRDHAFEQFVRNKLLMPTAEARAGFDKLYPVGYFGLRAAFSADGKYGRWLLDRPLMIVVNRTAFTHGGLPPLAASLGLEQINRLLRKELHDYIETWQKLIDRNLIPNYAHALEVEKIITQRLAAINSNTAPPTGDDQLIESFDRLSRSDLFDDDGPLWYRGSALCHPLLETPVTAAALAKLDVDRVVVGHTPTRNYRVHRRMNDRVFVLDTGMLHDYYQGVPSALVMGGDQIDVIYAADHRSDPRPDDDKTLEQFLRRAPIASRQADSNIVTLRENTHTAQAVFGQYGNPYEIVAYRIDRMLGLGMVPVTVKRKIEGRRGTLSWRAEKFFDDDTRVAGGTPIPAWCASGTEYDLMYAFDALVANQGRSRQNILYFGPEQSLRLTGFSNAFGTGTDFPAYLDSAEPVLSPELARRLESLNSENLGRELNGLLGKRQIRALLNRRDQILATWPRTTVLE